MKTLKVKPENLEVGKRYLMESKNRDFQAFIKVIEIDIDNGGVYVCNDGHKDITPYDTKWYTFYSVPEDFEMRWNQRYSSSESIFATIELTQCNSLPASIDLLTGQARNSRGGFSDIPDEPETITISGKTYNLDEVTNRIKELKPMENK